MEKNYLIYKATFPSNKVYIGLTSMAFKERIQCHNKTINLNKFNTRFTRMVNAIKKYGTKNIIWEILEQNLNKEESIYLEKYYIKQYDSYNRKFGYNSTLGGDGHMSKHSEEMKKALSKKHKNNPIFKECGKVLNNYYKNNEKQRSINGKKSMLNVDRKESAKKLLNYYNNLNKIKTLVRKDNNDYVFDSRINAAKFIGCSSNGIKHAIKTTGIIKNCFVKEIKEQHGI